MQLTIESVDATHVWVDFDQPDDLSIAAGTSLVAITRPASIYSDPYAQVALNNSQLTVDSSGRAAFFLKDSRADALVTGTGLNTRIYSFLTGGYRAGNSSWLNAMDFPSIQAAVDALPPLGGTVFIPAGGYSPTSTPSFNPPLVMPFDRPVRILGEGRELTKLSYRFVDAPNSFDPNHDLIQLTGNYQTIEDLSLIGGRSPFATGYGSAIRIWRTDDIPNDDGLIFGSAVRRVAIFDVPGFGIKVDDAPRNGVIQCAVWTSYDDLLVQNCGLGGTYLGIRTTTQSFRNCNFRSMGGQTLDPNPSVLALGSSGLSFRDCIFDDLGGTAIQLSGVNSIVVDHCWFEGRLPLGVPCIGAEGTYSGLRLASCIFINNIETQPSRDNLLALRAGGIGRSIVVSDAVILLNFGDGSNAEIPNIEIIAPAPGTASSEATIVGGALRDSTGLQTAPHCLLRTEGGGGMTALLGSAWRSRVASLTTTARDSVSSWSAGDLIFNSEASIAQMFDGAMWHDLWS